MSRENTCEVICVLRAEASRLIDQGYYEDAIPKLKQCLSLEKDLGGKADILCDLGFCFLRMGWNEDAAKIFSQYLKTSPFDNDVRFYLASTYASMRWMDESIGELKKILRSDPTDVLAYHALGLCYRDKGWLQDALDTMNAAKEHAAIHGNEEEKAIVEQSLADLEKEIRQGEEDKIKKGILLAILLVALKKRRNP